MAARRTRSGTGSDSRDGAPAPAARADLARVQAVLADTWRREAALIVATVARMVRDIGLAEDLAQDALLAALDTWPRDGLPDRPAAWLTTTARNRALDLLRRDTVLAAKLVQIGADLQAREALTVPDFVDALDDARADAFGDDMLRLVFTACHPLLSPDARSALTLKCVAGLSTEEIARAFLSSEATVAQRIVRAKRTLAEAGVPFEMPQGAALRERLASVLEVVYLLFNAGYSAVRGPALLRGDLVHEALRLSGLLARHLDDAAAGPDAAEVQALDALLALQASRSAARVDTAGQPVLLAEQDRSRWDGVLIQRGLAALQRATVWGAAHDQPAGPYALQAAIAACHARAATAASTDWAHIAQLYDRLLAVQPSPVVALNRAVAVGLAQGPAAALPLMQALLAEPALRDYPWLASAMADLLARLGRHGEAEAGFRHAATLTANQAEQALLLRRADEQQRLGRPA
ncbi:RNA polymerase sigma factor [Aquabacterium sp. OR-4]|uniref:RNA polymerase sigma factor n=1 Tax=Aquabacterium sp. OR-4 TaxID=2978127 RepID=UPI0021B44C7E|nr:sigma-70 family RNA polymerase sigma factor [Aquabacterium sp. OR-4]MDT7838391.1 sigma-70 family RNA polymerase sigma factor [Aquabacterium sp. OR-4]